jgi:hypothetical protein
MDAQRRSRQVNSKTSVFLGWEMIENVSTNVHAFTNGISILKGSHELVFGIKASYYESHHHRELATGWEGDWMRKRMDAGLFGGVNSRIYKSFNLEGLLNLYYTSFQFLPKTSLDIARSSRSINLVFLLLPNLRLKLNESIDLKLYAGVSLASISYERFQVHNPNLSLKAQKSYGHHLNSLEQIIFPGVRLHFRI